MAETEAAPLVVNRSEEEQGAKVTLSTFLTLETTTLFILGRAGSDSSNRPRTDGAPAYDADGAPSSRPQTRAMSTSELARSISLCWKCFLFVWWAGTLAVGIAGMAIGLGHDNCPGLDDLGIGMTIYGSLLMLPPLAYFMGLAARYLNALGLVCGARDVDYDDGYRCLGVAIYFATKAILFLALFGMSINGGQEVFGFYEKYTTCPDPIPDPNSFDPDPDSCQCDPILYWFAFSTLITLYIVFSVCILSFFLIIGMLICVGCNRAKSRSGSS